MTLQSLARDVYYAGLYSHIGADCDVLIDEQFERLRRKAGAPPLLPPHPSHPPHPPLTLTLQTHPPMPPLHPHSTAAAAAAAALLSDPSHAGALGRAPSLAKAGRHGTSQRTVSVPSLSDVACCYFACLTEKGSDVVYYEHPYVPVTYQHSQVGGWAGG